jgi:hypothetical protein
VRDAISLRPMRPSSIIFVICLLTVLGVGESFAGSDCAGHVRRSVYGKVSEDLRSKVIQVAERLLANPADEFPGWASGVLLRAWRAPAANVQVEEKVGDAIARFDAQMRTVESSIFDHEVVIKNFIRVTVPLPRNSGRAIGKTGQTFGDKWKLAQFSIQTLPFNFSLPNAEQRVLLKPLAAEIFHALLLAREFGLDSAVDALLVRLVLTADYPTIIAAAEVLPRPSLSMNIARQILSDFFQSPTTMAPESLEAALRALRQPGEPSLALAGRAMLYDFARQLTRADFPVQVSLRVVPSAEMTAKMTALFFEYAFRALHYTGNPGGLGMTPMGEVQRQYSVEDPAVLALARELFARIDEFPFPRVGVIGQALPLLEKTGDAELMARWGAQLDSIAFAEREHPAVYHLVSARLMYAAGYLMSARENLLAFLDGEHRDLALPISKFEGAAAAMAVGKDADGLAELIRRVNRRLATFARDISPTARPEFDRWLSLGRHLRALRRSPSTATYLSHFRPWALAPELAQPWIRASADLRRITLDAEIRLRAPEVREGLIERGQGLLSSNYINEAAQCFTDAVYRPGLIQIADRLASLGGPPNLENALRYYLLASQVTP